MKRLLGLLCLGLSACSFAPLSIPVPDFDLPAGTSFGIICYQEVTEAIKVKFASVRYEADALYTSNSSLQSSITLKLFGRTSDPDPGSSLDVKCVSQTPDDIALSEDISLVPGIQKRISAGGAELASLVTQAPYWIGASITDSAIINLPGEIAFTNGVMKANF